MNSLGLAVLLVAVACASAGIVGGPIDTAAVIAGPSGTVVRSGVHAAYAAPIAHAAYAAPIAHAAYAAPIAHAAHGIVAAPYAAYAVPAGSGLEGQWIPDINEKLYDDGSYKPYIYGL